MAILKGAAVIGQSGGPTAAINATLSGVISGLLENSELVTTVYGMRNGIEGFADERLINLSDEFLKDGEIDRERLRLLSGTPAAALGSCRKKLPAFGDDEAYYEKLMSLFEKYDIRYFFYIGGNDSMDTVAKLSAYTEKHNRQMIIAGVPKTIDNDLAATDHTPGFGSAAKYIATTVQEIIRDCAVYTVPAVTIIEIMGRDAGWLTASASLSGVNTGEYPDYIYLPERAFSLDSFLDDVKAALKRHPNVVIAVSEGLRCADGSYVGESAQSGVLDVFGHKYLSGTGKALEMLVKEKIGCKVRSVELNLPQRCAAHSASLTDINESIAVGHAAAEAALQGRSGFMMSIKREREYAVSYEPKPVSEIANAVRCVPDEYINSSSNGITEAGIKYLLPLIQGEMAHTFKNGLPDVLVF